MENLVRSQDPEGPTSEDPSCKFSLEHIHHHMKTQAPQLFDLLLTLILPLVRYDNTDPEHHVKDAESGAVYTMAMLLKYRSQRSMGLPLITSLMMISRGTNREVIYHSKQSVQMTSQLVV